MVSKETVIRAIAILVIASFMLELFVVVLYSNPNSSNNGVEPTALASIQPGDLTPGLPGANGAVPQLFIGTGETNATLVAFSPQNILQCPELTGNAVEADLSTIPGVNNTRNYGGGVIGFEADARLTPALFAPIADAAKNAAVKAGCSVPNATVYRLATVKLSDAPIVLSSAVVPTNGTKRETQTMTPRAVAAYFASVGQSPFALANPENSANSTVRVAVVAQLTNGLVIPQQGGFVNLAVVSQPLPASGDNSNSSSSRVMAGSNATEPDAPLEPGYNATDANSSAANSS